MDEKQQAKELNAKFKSDARNHGVNHALNEVHRFNAEADARDERARTNAMEGMASNRIMAGFKSGFGWRPNPRAGKRSVTSTAVKDGVRGLLTQNFLDGELVSETFSPSE
jgi:hypothetical protein